MVWVRLRCSVRRFSYQYGPWIVATAFSISGVVHLVHPATFTGIVPRFLPFSTALVYASGVAELICAVGLWRRRRWAGYAAAILLLVVCGQRTSKTPLRPRVVIMMCWFTCFAESLRRH
jgi:hypothetical protein